MLLYCVCPLYFCDCKFEKFKQNFRKFLQNEIEGMIKDESMNVLAKDHPSNKIYSQGEHNKKLF